MPAPQKKTSRKKTKRTGSKKKNRLRFTVAKVEEALRRSVGIRSMAANLLGCAPNTVRNYIDRYPRLAQAETEILDFNLDLAEAKLQESIRKGNLTAVIFYLKCKGKERGYTERSQIVGPDGGPVLLKPDLSALTDDDLKKLRKLIAGKDNAT